MSAGHYRSNEVPYGMSGQSRPMASIANRERVPSQMPSHFGEGPSAGKGGGHPLENYNRLMSAGQGQMSQRGYQPRSMVGYPGAGQMSFGPTGLPNFPDELQIGMAQKPYSLMNVPEFTPKASKSPVNMAALGLIAPQMLAQSGALGRPAGGALSGGMTGAQLGSQIAPGWGTAIGGGLGGLMGLAQGKQGQPRQVPVNPISMEGY